MSIGASNDERPRGLRRAATGPSAVQVTQGFGGVAGMEISADGTKMLFAMRGPFDPNLDDDDQATWNIWEYEIPTGALRRIIASDITADYSYYYVSLGYNLLPGESFIGRNRAEKTALYVIGGAGSTSFAGDEGFTSNVGLGVRVSPVDWPAVDADVRDHVFDIDLLGQEKATHNPEAHVGVTFFF